MAVKTKNDNGIPPAYKKLEKDKPMKTMTCNQLGGACDKAFTANSFEEIVEQSKLHGMEMFQKQDKDHLEAMNKVMVMMQDPSAMAEWFDSKQKEFEAQPED